MKRTMGEGASQSPADDGNARQAVTDSNHGSPWQRLFATNTVWIFFVLIVLVAIFSAMKPSNFPTEFNIRAIATNAAVLLIMATGETFIIITAGVDLSIGYVCLFSSVTSAQAMQAFGDPTNQGWGVILLGLLVALASGLAWGVANGVLVAKAHVPPLIVTLGTLGMAWGFAEIISGGQDVRTIPLEMAETIGQGRVLGVPWLVIIAAAVTIAGTVVLSRTRFGRYTFVIGSNEAAARRAGINVERHLVKVYALNGLLAGFAGFLSLAFFTTTTLGGHSTDNLNAIAAVVIGGTSLFGGSGTVVGTTIGVFIPAVLQSGFVIVGMVASGICWKSVTAWAPPLR